MLEYGVADGNVVGSTKLELSTPIGGALSIISLINQQYHEHGVCCSKVGVPITC